MQMSEIKSKRYLSRTKDDTAIGVYTWNCGKPDTASITKQLRV